MESNDAITESSWDPTRSPSKDKSSGRLGRKSSDSKKGKKIGHRRVTNQGTVTYKKTPTSDIQRAIQLGIQHSIGTLQQKPCRDVLFRDFEVVETVDFPRSGTKTTPAHGLSDFRFRTFAPVAFRSFRDHFELDIRDYLNSLCSQELRELSNPGASGSIFYISADDEFIIKTVQHKEANFLQKLLPEYYMNLVQHTRTLLPKFYGLHCYQCSGKNIRFVVMNNLLPSSIKMHERYDLKGSSYKRKANARELSKASPTLKDLDFKDRHPEGISLEADTYEALMKTIERDCRVLESFQIMDYSLLLGVHNFDQAERERQQRRTQQHPDNGVIPEDSTAAAATTNIPSGLGLSNSVKRLSADAVGDSSSLLRAGRRSASPFTRNAPRAKSGKPRLTAFSTAMESIEAKAEPVEIEPADPQKATLLGGLPARNAAGERLFLFIGVIDILQSYRIAKKMEHTFKSVVTDAETVSVTNPSFYAKRFQHTIGSCIFKKIASLDQPQLFGQKAARFRRVAHLGCMSKVQAMKQNSARRLKISAKPPIPLRIPNDFMPGSASPASDNISSVTTWPRRVMFQPGRSSAYSSGHSSGYSTMAPTHNAIPPSPSSTSNSFSYPHCSSVPTCWSRSGFGNESRLFRNRSGELSWCAQSLLSIPMDSDAASETEMGDSASDNDSLTWLDGVAPIGVEGKVMTTRGELTVDELDLELAAVQKMVRRDKMRAERREQLMRSSLLSLQLSGAPRTESYRQFSTVQRQSSAAKRRGGLLADLKPVDSRSRKPSNEGSPAGAPLQRVSVSASALSAFMRDAVSDFD